MNEEIAKIFYHLNSLTASIKCVEYSLKNSVNQLTRIADVLTAALDKEANDGEGNRST